MNNYLTVPYSIFNLSDINLTSKILLALIISLSKKEGYCFASNEFFSNVLGITDRTVVNSMRELRENKYITSERKKYIRYIKLNLEKLIASEIPEQFIKEKLSLINENLSIKKENFSDRKENISQYNNNYNNKYKYNYNPKRSYDLEELMKIK